MNLHGKQDYSPCHITSPTHNVHCLTFVCGKLYAKNKFNQRSEKYRSKGKQSKETK